MFSRLLLKKKDAVEVVYNYSIAEPDAPRDGEVAYNHGVDKSRLLKPATGDADGRHAHRWVLPYLRRIVFDRGCPEKDILAFG